MKFAIAAVLSLSFAIPALCNTHKDTYPVPCSELWAAVKDTLRNSGNYGIVSTDEAGMTASYTVGNTLRQRANSVVLNSHYRNPQGFFSKGSTIFAPNDFSS